MADVQYRVYDMGPNTFTENYSSASNREGTLGIQAFNRYEFSGKLLRAYRVNSDFTLSFGPEVAFPHTDQEVQPGYWPELFYYPDWVYPTVAIYRLYRYPEEESYVYAVKINSDLTLTINEIHRCFIPAILTGYGSGALILCHLDGTKESTILQVDSSGNATVARTRSLGIPALFEGRGETSAVRLSADQYLMRDTYGDYKILAVSSNPTMTDVTLVTDAPINNASFEAANTTVQFPAWPVAEQTVLAVYYEGAYPDGQWKVGFFKHNPVTATLESFGTPKSWNYNDGYQLIESLGNGTITLFNAPWWGDYVGVLPIRVNYDYFGPTTEILLPIQYAVGDSWRDGQNYYLNPSNTARAKKNGVILFTDVYDDPDSRAFVTVVYTPEPSITGSTSGRAAKFLRPRRRAVSM